MSTINEERRWWKDAIVYQIYPRSFADANGDGKGDLDGIISKLDYLKSLSVDAVWMSPCFPSPQHDHGYDVADYFDINPTYGSLETFDRLIAEGKKRGIKVMLDVVPNHCSKEHEWFQAALASPKGSAARQRFYFRDGRGPHGEQPPNNWLSIFGGPSWTRITEPDGTPGQWYLHVFDSSQPDLNWENDDVKLHFDDMLTFWFDRGVEGFRVDAVTVVGKTDGLPDGPDVPEGLLAAAAATLNPHFQMKEVAHSYWRRWRKLINEYEQSHPGRHLVTISEAYTPKRPDMLLRFVEPDQFHQSFCFDLMLTPWNAELIRTAVKDVYDVLTGAGANLSWTLNNHDTQRAVTRYGRSNATDPSSWTGNNLIYNDAPIDLSLGARRARAMIQFAAALPGALYVYQGEELGLPEWLDLPDGRREDPLHFRTNGKEKGRDGCRVPLPWTTDRSTNFGFSQRTPAGDSWLPQPQWWGDYAMSNQDGAAGSMLEFYRELLARRREIDVESPLEWVMFESTDVVAFIRGGHLVVLNVSNRPVEISSSVVGARRATLCSELVVGTTVAANSSAWFV